MSDQDHNDGGGAAEGAAPERGVPLSSAELLAFGIQMFAPHLTEEQLVELTRIMLREQPQTDQIYASAVDPKLRKQHSIWGLRIFLKKQQVGEVTAPKKAELTMQPHEVIAHATVVALLDSPRARALIRAYGLNYDFFQRRGPSDLILM